MQIKIDFKIFIIMIIFIITRNIGMYATLMIFALIHELGHLTCGLLLGFKPKSISVIPYGFKLGFEVNYKDYNVKIKKGTKLTLKKIIIALSGPITNVICMIILIILKNKINIYQYQIAMYSNILLALFNLIPIYPLDGGRVLQGILHLLVGLRESYTYVNIVTNINIIILTAISSILILYYKNIAILFVILYLWTLVYQANKEYTLKEKLYNKVECYNSQLQDKMSIETKKNKRRCKIN